MAVSLRLVRGPLEEAGLRAIVSLYGRYNSKYADVEFCRNVFNGNVHGWALHAFLVSADGHEVGHYALVPITLSREGERVISGKGEAFAILEEIRSESLAVGDGPAMPCGLAMAGALYQFGEQHGLDPIHMVASEDVGLLHRMAGCRALRIPQRRAVLAVRPARLAAGEPNPARRALVFLGAVCQLFAAQVLLRGFSARRTLQVWDVDQLGAEQRARLAERLPRLTNWSPRVDVPALEWFARVGRLQVVATDERFEDHAVICRRVDQDRVMEVLSWRLSQGDPSVAARLLAGVVAEARAARDVVVCFTSDTLGDGPDLARLFEAGRRTMFRERPRQILLFVRSRNRVFLDPDTFRFSPFFYAVF